MMHRLLIAALAMAPLAACDSKAPGTQIAFSANDSAGSIGNRGEVKIDTPAFQGTFRMPKINLTAENFDVNGVHLYPGSRIAAVNVAGGKDEEDGKVTVRFESPADADTVRGWFADQFAKAGTKVSVKGNRLTGKSDDDEGDFTIDLAPAGGKTGGVVHIG